MTRRVSTVLYCRQPARLLQNDSALLKSTFQTHYQLKQPVTEECELSGGKVPDEICIWVGMQDTTRECGTNQGRSGEGSDRSVQVVHVP